VGRTLKFGAQRTIPCIRRHVDSERGIGLDKPPVGSVQFVVREVGRISIGESMRTIWPFYSASIAVLALVAYVHGLSLPLPRPFH
jgi:TRAP-type C4-dicarboxylate transport system permease large subunit